MNKINRFLEIFWLVVASLTTLGSIVVAFIDGFVFMTYMSFLFAGLAWGVYMVKVGIRKRMEVIEQVKKDKKTKKK